MCLLVRTCGPQKTMVISGVGYSRPKCIRGGRVFQIPCFHTVSKLRMNIMTLQVHSVDVNCATGVNITLNGVAQVKINGADKGNLNLACQHFLDMKEDEMNEILTRTMEGHQRSIISTMSVEEVFRDRIKFAERVHEVASIDLMKMGIQIVSYTLSSVTTSNGYSKF